jgi:NADPH:quinone reductase-like Zn-dependent oxidoreductase
MKAIVYDEFGPPDVLRLADVDPPTPKEHEVLVKVRAAAVNPLDWHFIRGEPSVMRLFGKPKARIPGGDVAGTVEAVGPNVSRFRPGDEVFGGCRGSFAEYVCGHEDRLAPRPARLTLEQAAAIPVAGCTALQALRDYGRVRSGQSVLVNGAAGGVGTFAVQIAKALGADVTGVCSARNVELVRSIGADQVIDYTAEDFTRQARRYDLILGVAGNAKVPDMRRALTPRGTLVVVGGGVGRDPDSGVTVPGMLALMFVALASRLGRQRVSMLVAKIRSDDLELIAKLADEGKLTPVIDRAYSLDDAAEAVRYLEAGHARGKIVVTPPHA